VEEIEMHLHDYTEVSEDLSLVTPGVICEITYTTINNRLLGLCKS